jgi:ABC-type oligopeptide transport system substrate-binding subunit
MVVIDKEQVRLLEQRLRGIGVDRRTFMKFAGAALAAPGMGSILAACGGDDNNDAEPTNTTTSSGTTSEPTATTKSSSAAPTTAAASPTTSTAAEPTATTGSEAASPTSAEPDQGAMDDDQTFHVIGVRQEPASHDFNADLYCGGASDIWAGLLTYNADLTPIPDWAEKWEANDDASVWTFYLRKDNKGFSNGDPVTADTFIYSWKRLLKPETKGAYASILFDIKGAEDINLNSADPDTLGVKAIDDWTLEVTMVGPRGIFPVIAGYVACFPTHPPTAEKGGSFTDPATLGGPLTSNGAFTLTEWKHDESCTLVKNDNYWDPNVKLQKIDWKIIPAEQGMLPYEAGEVDYALVPGADLPRIQQDATMSKELQKWVEPLIWKMLPQVTKAPFDDIEARRALQHSVDKDRINDLTNGGGDPAYCLVPPGLFGYFGEEFKDYSDFDPAKVDEHLAKSKYADKNWPEVTMIERNEAQLNSTIMSEDVVAQVQDHMGLEMKLQIMDLQAFRQLQFSLEPQIVWIRWYYDYPDPNNGYYDMFYSNKDSGRRQAWSNKEFDDLTIKAKEASKPEDRLDLYRQCEKIMNEEVAYVPVVYRNAYYVYKPWVKDVPVNKQGYWVPNGNIYVTMYHSVYISGRNA